MKSWIENVIFDLDGVLVDTHGLHFDAFATVLLDVGVVITLDWYYRYNGVTSREKLNILVDEGKILPTSIDDLMHAKEVETIRLIKERIKPSEKITSMLTMLKNENRYKFGIASNSRSDFVWLILSQMNIRNIFSAIVSGNEVRKGKPSPEIYVKCMAEMNASPAKTIIFEDTSVGLKAAYDSGAQANRCSVDTIDYEYVKEVINDAGLVQRASHNSYHALGLQPFVANIVVPMAGYGSRFKTAGYEVPKPFIDINGRPMVQVTCDSIQIPGRYIFCVQEEHYEERSDDIFNFMALEDKLVRVKGVTEGAACTVLKTKKMIDNDFPLFIVNSDQYIEWDWFRFMNEVEAQGAHGGIVTFEAEGTKWSYAKTEPGTNIVTEVAEKNPISTHATAGIYYWRKGSDFVRFAESMIEKNVRVNNEFYVCPVYNQAIQEGLKIITFPCEKMLGMGTPEDLKKTVQLL